MIGVRYAGIVRNTAFVQRGQALLGCFRRAALFRVIALPRVVRWSQVMIMDENMTIMVEIDIEGIAAVEAALLIVTGAAEARRTTLTGISLVTETVDSMITIGVGLEVKVEGENVAGTADVTEKIDPGTGREIGRLTGLETDPEIDHENGPETEIDLGTDLGIDLGIDLGTGLEIDLGAGLAIDHGIGLVKGTAIDPEIGRKKGLVKGRRGTAKTTGIVDVQVKVLMLGAMKTPSTTRKATETRARTPQKRPMDQKENRRSPGSVAAVVEVANAVERVERRSVVSEAEADRIALQALRENNGAYLVESALLYLVYYSYLERLNFFN